MSEVKLKKSSGSKRKASTTSAPEEVEQSVVVDATINDSEEMEIKLEDYILFSQVLETNST